MGKSGSDPCYVSAGSVEASKEQDATLKMSWPGGKKSVSWRWSPQDQVAGGQVGKVEPLVIRSQPLAYAAQRRLLHYSLLVSTSATSLPPEPPLYVLVGVHHSMERFSPGATPPTILQPIRRCAQQYNCLVLYFH